MNRSISDTAQNADVKIYTPHVRRDAEQLHDAGMIPETDDVISVWEPASARREDRGAVT